MSISNAAELSILDAVFNATAYSVATPYVSLHTADANETGTDECTGGSYIRKLGSFDPAADGATTTNAALTWTNMPACTVHSVGIWTAESSGTFVWGGNLTVEKTLNSGDTFQINSGDLDITLD